MVAGRVVVSNGVRFGPPAHDPAPYLIAGLPLPCNVCGDDIREHTYLYTLGDRDLYRCRKPWCKCGAKAEIRGVALSANPTDEQIAAAMAELAAGGGEIVRPT